MLISHLHLWSRVCPPHHYASLLLLSSLLTRQPLRSPPPIFSFMLSFVTHSANTDPGCCWRWGFAGGLHRVSLFFFRRDQLGQTTPAQLRLLHTNETLESLQQLQDFPDLVLFLFSLWPDVHVCQCTCKLIHIKSDTSPSFFPAAGNYLKVRMTDL